MAVIGPDPDAVSRRIWLDDDGHGQHEHSSLFGQLEIELPDDAGRAIGDRDLPRPAIALAKPAAAGLAEVDKRGLTLDPPEARVVDANPAREGLPEARRIAAVQGGPGCLEVFQLPQMGRVVDDLTELGEPGHRGAPMRPS